jgi:hypothetical protein
MFSRLCAQFFTYARVIKILDTCAMYLLLLNGMLVRCMLIAMIYTYRQCNTKNIAPISAQEVVKEK